MKTQIILRTVLVAVALFVSLNNNGSYMRSSTHTATQYSNTGNSSVSYSKEETKNSSDGNASHSNAFGKEGNDPYIPQPGDDHDFDCFDFKHHEKRNFWRRVANRLFVILYDIVVLSPIAIEVLKQLLNHA